MISVKRGSTFSMDATFIPNPDGGIQTLENVTITSEVRKQNGVLVANLTTEIDPTFMIFSCTGETADWPVGTVEWDIKFSHEGNIFYSETVEIEVIRSVTQ